MSLNNKILQGIYWSSIQTIIEQTLSFSVKLVLARLLFPEDFGLVAMAVVFTSFVSVFNDIGIGAALVQRKASELREEHYHTSFWTGVIWSIILYTLIAFVVSPLAANFYSEPILTQLIPVLAIGILASPINLVHKAQLTKELNFKSIALIGNSCNIFSGILALILAFLGFGVWSLVFNSVASILIAIPFYFKATGWTPKLIWEKDAFKDIFGFGIYTTGSAFFNNLISKIDYLLIGKFVSASALGSYAFAFMLTDILRAQLMSIMNKVMYPIYGQKQDDLKSLKSYYLKVVRYNSLMVYPIMTLILLIGEDIVYYFFGNKWEMAIIPMKILSISVFFHMMVNSNTALIRGLGKPKLELQLQLFKAIILYVPLISIGVYLYGIIGVAYAILINKIFSVFIAQYYLKKLININIADLIKSINEPILATLISIILSSFLKIYYQPHFLVIGIIEVAIFAIIYYVLMKKELLSLLNVAKKINKK